MLYLRTANSSWAWKTRQPLTQGAPAHGTYGILGLHAHGGQLPRQRPSTDALPFDPTATTTLAGMRQIMRNSNLILPNGHLAGAKRLIAQVSRGGRGDSRLGGCL